MARAVGAPVVAWGGRRRVIARVAVMCDSATGPGRWIGVRAEVRWRGLRGADARRGLDRRAAAGLRENGGSSGRGAGEEFGDRGSGTLWMLAMIGVIWFVAVVAMAVGGVRVARHRAYAAADLAALGAAAHAADGAGRACGLAARIARGSGGRMSRCRLHGRLADVWVSSKVPLAPHLPRLTVTARARAGPVGPGTAPVPGTVTDEGRLVTPDDGRRRCSVWFRELQWRLSPVGCRGPPVATAEVAGDGEGDRAVGDAALTRCVARSRDGEDGSFDGGTAW